MKILAAEAATTLTATFIGELLFDSRPVRMHVHVDFDYIHLRSLHRGRVVMCNFGDKPMTFSAIFEHSTRLSFSVGKICILSHFPPFSNLKMCALQNIDKRENLSFSTEISSHWNWNMTRFLNFSPHSKSPRESSS
jgi:hypothetical protein